MACIVLILLTILALPMKAQEPVPLCVPYSLKTGSGSTLQNWCGLGVESGRFFDETFEVVKGDWPEWVGKYLWIHPVVIQTVWDYSGCRRTLKYAVLAGQGVQFLVVHPDIFRTLDQQGLAQALTLLANVAQWRSPSNVGVFYGCLD